MMLALTGMAVTPTGKIVASKTIFEYQTFDQTGMDCLILN
jgi:hypothetical protein